MVSSLAEQSIRSMRALFNDSGGGNASLSLCRRRRSSGPLRAACIDADRNAVMLARFEEGSQTGGCGGKKRGESFQSPGEHFRTFLFH